MRTTVIILFFTLIFTFFPKTGSMADEGSVEFCGFTYSIHSCDKTSRIYLGCAGSVDTLELIVINPESLEIENSFPIQGLLQDVHALDNGDTLLILLVETDGDPETLEGALQKIDASTGEILAEHVFNYAPLAMAVDPEESFAYVTSVLDFDISASVDKISLSDFQKKNTMMFGSNPDSIAITDDGSKLYIKCEEVFVKDDEDDSFEFYWRIGVINSINMTIKDTIRIPVMPASLEMGQNNTLYISNSMPISEENMDFSVLIANTETDEIIEMLSFSEVGAWIMAYDPHQNTLYCTASPRTHFNPVTGEYTHETSSLVLAIDCNDLKHEVLTLGDDPLWDIALVSFDNNSRRRIFGITRTDSPKVHYRDLK